MAVHDTYVDLGQTAQIDANDGMFTHATWPGSGADSYWQTPGMTITESDAANVLDDDNIATTSTAGIPTMPNTVHDAYVCEVLGALWFGFVHIFPRLIALGNIISDQVVTISIHNAFRTQSVDWDSVTNNLGAGTALVGLPSFPDTIGPQDGREITLEVDADTGPAQVDSNIVYVFDVPTTITQPVSFQRLVIWPFLPQAGLNELLRFSTQVFPGTSGQEQRRSRSENPRQVIAGVYRMIDETDRQRAQGILFDHQSRRFGVPVPWEANLLTVAASATDTVITVDTTNYSDFRVGGLCFLWNGNDETEAQEIASFTATTITFVSGLTAAFPVNSLVFPMRVADANDDLSITQYPVTVEDFPISFSVADNESNLADVSAFSSWDDGGGARVLLDDANVLHSRSLAKRLFRRVSKLDSVSGQTAKFSPWDRGKPGQSKGVRTMSRQQLWEYRQLLHALRGRAVYFYLPTFFDDVTLSQDLASASTNMDINNVGYAKFIKNRSPYNVIRVVETDGTKHIRKVTGSSELSITEERLSVDSGWPGNIAAVDVERVEFLVKSRLGSDDISIKHFNAIGDASFTLAIAGLF